MLPTEHVGHTTPVGLRLGGPPSTYGLGAPKNTPVEVIAKLNGAINSALAESKTKAQLADLGLTELAGSPAEFGKLIAEETEKWGKVVKFSGAKPD
jgi:tripartite-type tricarboxylate transporter receptor subunit TctC